MLGGMQKGGLAPPSYPDDLFSPDALRVRLSTIAP